MGIIKIARRFRAFISKYFSSPVGSEVFIHQNKAIRGYDPVSFFLDGMAVEGVEEIKTKWKGATWHFSSLANLETFISSPEKYAPQYGGYCAHGIANGYKAHTDPSTWEIIEGKLYFSYSQKIKGKWIANSKERIKKANQRWSKVKSINKIKYSLY